MHGSGDRWDKKKGGAGGRKMGDWGNNGGERE